MNLHHTVQSLEFEDEWMVLTVDGHPHRWPIAQLSSRLAVASLAERQIYRISPSGYGIHWPAIDEDLSIDGLLRIAEPESTNANAS
jgi:hypothetical protein